MLVIAKAEMSIHAGALLLALVAGIITMVPYILLWSEPGYRGIEMMMLDAENHYQARIHEVYEGHPRVSNTFLSNKDGPYTTPPFGEIIIAVFGKIFRLDAARAATISRFFSVVAITLLVYAFSFALSRSRIAALIASAFTVLGYNLIVFSPAPFIDLAKGAPTGGPFLLFSRLVNPSISGIFLFGALALMYRRLLDSSDEKIKWQWVGTLGVVVGTSLYVSPFVFSFLSVLLFLVWVWLFVRQGGVNARAAFFAGCIAIACAIPFALNYGALHALPEYETVARYLGVVPRREFVLGALLPLMVALIAFVWPRTFPRTGRTFLFLACGAIFFVINLQLITGVYLQGGHYHWYVTKPLAGIIAGLLVGGIIERFVQAPFRRGVVALILSVLIFNSMGFVAPWYAETRKVALATQAYGPLVEYLQTLKTPQTIWTDGETADFIPIYTAHNVPNTVNLGSYPIPQVFFDNRLFLEYRLRGIVPEDFEGVIREEAHHVGDRLWGLWLRELTGDSSAIPEEEFSRLTADYTVFYKKTWEEAFGTLGITLVAIRVADRAGFDAISWLREIATIGDFVVYTRAIDSPPHKVSFVSMVF